MQRRGGHGRVRSDVPESIRLFFVVRLAIMPTMINLPADSIIAPAKLKDYLLVWQGKDDKSQWLATVGYTADNWQQLDRDLRQQVLPLEAEFVEATRFGQMFEIKGTLTGPNGKTLFLRSFWMFEFDSGQTKFITLYPDKVRTK